MLEALGPLEDAEPGTRSVPSDGTLRDALAIILELGAHAVPVVDESGRPLGSVGVDTIVARFRKPLP